MLLVNYFSNYKNKKINPMETLYYILLLITLVINIGALISFIKAPVARVSGKIPQLNVSKTVDIYTKDYPKNDTVKGMLITIIILSILIIITQFFIHSSTNSGIYPLLIQIILALSMIVAAIVGIVFLSLINFKNTAKLNVKNIFLELDIHTNNLNINVINALSYMGYAFTIITGIYGLLLYGFITVFFYNVKKSLKY